MEIDLSIVKIAVASVGLILAQCAPNSRDAEGFEIQNGTGVQAGDTPTHITHTGYSLLYSEMHEQPYWVAYDLTNDEVWGTAARIDNFREDSTVPTGSAQLADYKNSGYDRGHLKPAADSKASSEEMDASFFLSNISPQYPDFNREIWNTLEEKVRDYAVAEKRISVVTGPILNNPIGKIGENQVSVPEGFFKVILSRDSSKAIGFLMKHENSKEPLASFAVSVDSVEKVTGFDFFTGLTDSIESKYNYTAW